MFNRRDSKSYGLLIILPNNLGTPREYELNGGPTLVFHGIRRQTASYFGPSDQSTSVLCNTDCKSHMEPHIDRILLMASIY